MSTMFKKIKNIDTAFAYVRGFTMLIVLGSLLLNGLVLYMYYDLLGEMQDRIYVLSSGDVFQAHASSKNDNFPVEARAHIKRFHEYFFTLDPDDKAIAQTINKALYLADGSAKRQYDNLMESGFYASLIAGNINQTIQIDSIQILQQQGPIAFKCYARQQIIRSSSQTTRLLITKGALRQVSRSENNPHGFLVERWGIVQNKDLKTQIRK